jgi:hypothetical protein
MPLLQKGIALAVGRMPKIINPTVHAVLDYAVAGSFLLMGALYWRRNRRAAFAAVVCGGAKAVNNLITDYPGGVRKVLSYQNHGKVDAGLAGLTAAMPRLMSFDEDPEAKFFGTQALAETAITGLTNFDYFYEEPRPSRGRHHNAEDEGVA